MGRGIEKDKNTGLEWITRAADHGQASAQWLLGHFYRRGRGMEVDYEKAREWFKKAADRHYGKAANSLGDMYKLGQGVEKDRTKAIEWYKKALAWGCRDAVKGLIELDYNRQDAGEYLKSLKHTIQ